MHDYAYSARDNGATSPELEARLAEFAQDIAAALDGDCDEVLVVGHSSGAHLGVSVLADLIRVGRVPPDGPTLSFLSHGQVVPMVSFLPGAWRLRAGRPGDQDHDDTGPRNGCVFHDRRNGRSGGDLFSCRA